MATMDFSAIINNIKKAAPINQALVAVLEMDGTKASPPFLQEMAVPSLPIVASLAALAIYQRRLSHDAMSQNNKVKQAGLSTDG